MDEDKMLRFLVETNKQKLLKEARMGSELGALFTTGSIVPGANLIGALSALLRKKPTLLEFLARSAKGGSNFIPGVGAHRLVMRAKSESKLLPLLEKLVLK